MRKVIDWLSRFTGEEAMPAQPVERYHATIEPDDAVVYAVGDVHGCLDELRALESLIVEDARKQSGPAYIVMAGDYVDRGPNSAGVLAHLVEPAPDGLQRICLAGNHDASMLAFLKNRRGDPTWIRIGGAETLRSYGLEISRVVMGRSYLRTLADLAKAKVPVEHRMFLETLRWTVRFGDYLIVHAGLRPGVPLLDQTPFDLMWIRDDFIRSTDPLPYVVVHGHTPVERPVRLPNRIAIDTAAYATGRLTAARLSREGVTFLTTPAIGLEPLPALLAANH